jgi:thaumarchaeosortase
MGNAEPRTNKLGNALMRFIPFFSLIIPFAILYYLDPKSFEATWKGRTFYLFFLWIVTLEAIVNWEKIGRTKLTKKASIRTIVFVAVMVVPTLYVIAANYYGLNTAILDFASREWQVLMYWYVPLSVEYLVFTILFALLVFLEYGIEGLSNSAISVFFLGVIGLIYIIDTLYPYGRFTPFQFLVPATSMLAAMMLGMMGYIPKLTFMERDPIYGSLTKLEIKDSLGKRTSFNIAWPCSGIDSLLIYSVTILLFLKNNGMRLWQKIVLFVVGAVVTYFINALRIVSIFLLGATYGVGSTQVSEFHNFYGQLYSITWIVCYPLIIVGIQILSHWLKSNRRSKPRNLPKPIS